MLKDIDFILKADPEEISSVIESFLNRFKDIIANKEGLDAEKEFSKLLPLDKERFDIIEDMKKDFQRYSKSERVNPDYEKAYNILMGYWDSLPDEEKPKINKELKKLGI